MGIGHNHGSGKMQAFRKFPERFEVVGYAEEDATWRDLRGGWPCYSDLPRMSPGELLEKCDAVAVECAVPDLTRCARLWHEDAGKHIHLDKPGSGTLEEFGAMLESAQAKRLVVQMGYMYRYNPLVTQLLALDSERQIGNLFHQREMSTYHSVEYKRWLSTFRGGISIFWGPSRGFDRIFAGRAATLSASFLKHTHFLRGVDVADNNLSVLEYEKALARILLTPSGKINSCDDGNSSFSAAGAQ